MPPPLVVTKLVAGTPPVVAKLVAGPPTVATELTELAAGGRCWSLFSDTPTTGGLYSVAGVSGGCY